MNHDASPPPSLPLLLDDEWEAPPSNRARVGLIAAIISVAVIVICVGLVLRRAGMWEPEANKIETVWNPIAPMPAALAPDPDFHAAPVRAKPPVVVQGVRTTSKRRVREVRPGYLSINSSPWAELSLDGQVVGNTPQIKIRVTPGRHHLTLVRDGFQPHTAWVNVPAGGTLRLTDITLEAVTR